MSAVKDSDKARKNRGDCIDLNGLNAREGFRRLLRFYLRNRSSKAPSQELNEIFRQAAGLEKWASSRVLSGKIDLLEALGNSWPNRKGSAQFGSTSESVLTKPLDSTQMHSIYRDFEKSGAWRDDEPRAYTGPVCTSWKDGYCALQLSSKTTECQFQGHKALEDCPKFQQLSWKNCAIFIDLDNVYIAMQKQQKRLDIEKLLKHIDRHGLLRPGNRHKSRSFCYGDSRIIRDYEKHHRDDMVFRDCSTGMHGYSSKNSADIRLVIDAMKFLLNSGSPKNIDTFILISGDADFIPLIEEIRDKKLRVIVYSAIEAAAGIMVRYADSYFDLGAEKLISRNR